MKILLVIGGIEARPGFLTAFAEYSIARALCRAGVAFLIVLACLFTSLKAEAKDKELDYRKLVEGLVSPNTPIKCENRGDTVLSIPPHYNWKAQERIEEKRRVLFDHCEKALPFLIEGCTDARYSLTAPWQEGDAYSSCVGAICLEIIALHVEVFREQIRFSDPQHWHQYNFVPQLHSAIGKAVTDGRKKEIQDWWRERKHKSLYQLQIEAFDWAIEKRKEELKQLSDNRSRSEASDEIKSLVGEREKLNRSDKCLPPHHMWPSILSTKHYTVAPWNEKDQ